MSCQFVKVSCHGSCEANQRLTPLNLEGQPRGQHLPYSITLRICFERREPLPLPRLVSLVAKKNKAGLGLHVPTKHYSLPGIRVALVLALALVLLYHCGVKNIDIKIESVTVRSLYKLQSTVSQGEQFSLVSWWVLAGGESMYHPACPGGADDSTGRERRVDVCVIIVRPPPGW